MGVSATEFESFEQQFIELIGEFRSLTISDNRYRETLRAESTRAEAAEATRASAERAAAEARNSATAATAGATQAATALATANDQLTGTKLQLDLVERQRALLEERCMELSAQSDTLEKELQQLRPLQSAHSTLQRQYSELHDRVCSATEEARREALRLENELRRVERCASGGSEIRERARLAAAAHSREKRLAVAELKQTTQELLSANTEVTTLCALVAELQIRLAEYSTIASSKSKSLVDPDAEALIEARAALEAERAGTVRLEQALVAALADNTTLAADMHSSDNSTAVIQTTLPSLESSVSTNICPIGSFLAE